MTILKRPVVLLSLISLFEALIILTNPDLIIWVLCICSVLCVLSFIYFFRKKELASAFVFSFIIIFAAINPYLSYTNNEKKAEKLIEEYKENTPGTFCAKVSRCNNYGQYSTIYATLEYADKTPVKSRPNIRMSCFSGEAFDEGDLVVFEGTPIYLSEIKEDVFDTSSHLRSKYVFMDFPSVSVISSTGGKGDIFRSLRKYTRSVIYSYLPDAYNFEGAAVTYAMFAGETASLSQSINEDFRKSGTTHVICVSGMHLTIIISALYFVLSAITLHKNLKCVLVILLAIFYTAFTGFSLSTIRACIMCCITFVALIIGKNEDAYQSLFAAMLIICLFSPYSVLDISAQLSFLATLGILVFSDICPKNKSKNIFIRLIASTFNAFLTNIGAVLFTLPICAFSFGGISILSAVVTLIISIPCNLLLLLTLVLLVLSPLAFAGLGIVPEFLGFLCRHVCSFIIYTVRFFGSFKYAYVTSAHAWIYLLLFLISFTVLTVFIALDIKRARFFCVMFTLITGIVFSFNALNLAIIEDSQYKVNYYRKNEDDRQLSIKLGSEGYLIVNADSILCTSKDEELFDYATEKNHLLIIPDDNIEIPILSRNISTFKSRFGLEKIFVPDTKQGHYLASRLADEGIHCQVMPSRAHFNNICIEYSSTDFEYISVFDGKTRTSVIFADCYDREYFKDGADICAFFTRKTHNQFNPDIDTKPDCSLFFTRMKRGTTVHGIENTFSKKSFSIKG